MTCIRSLRAETDKCHAVTEEDDASSNTQRRLCIKAKLRHKQRWRKRGDTSVEDEIEESRVGLLAITSKFRVSI